MHIVLCLRDEPMAERLRAALSEHKHTVEIVPDSAFLEYAASRACVGLLIADSMLPGDESEPHTLKAAIPLIKQVNADLPIFALSSIKSVANICDVLQAGADDYLTVSFSFRELCCRIEALARRRRSHRYTEIPRFIVGHLRVGIATADRDWARKLCR